MQPLFQGASSAFTLSTAFGVHGGGDSKMGTIPSCTIPICRIPLGFAKNGLGLGGMAEYVQGQIWALQNGSQST